MKKCIAEIDNSLADQSVVLKNLHKFKKKNPESGNVYFQLGRIYFRRLLEHTVDSDSALIHSDGDSTLFYFTNAKKFTTDKELKNKAFQFESLKNYDSQLSLPVSKIVYDNLLDSLSAYSQLTTKVLLESQINFVAAQKKLDICVLNYRTLHQKYQTVNHLLFAADEEILAKLRNIKTDFDSVKTYLQKFYTLQNSQNQFQLININHFPSEAAKRIILKSTDKLPDYQTFCDYGISLVKNKIQLLKYLFINTNQAIETSPETPISELLAQGCEEFDKESLGLAYLQFKQSKGLLKKLYQDTLLQQSTANEYFAQHQKIAQHLLQTTDLLAVTESRAVGNNFDAYSFFLKDESFAYRQFLADLRSEKNQLDTVKQYFADLSREKLLSGNKKTETDKILWKEMEIPLHEQTWGLAVEPNKAVSHRIINDNIGNQFVLGYRKVKGNLPFVAQIRNKQPKWLMFPKFNYQFDNVYFEMIPRAIASMSGGCVAAWYASPQQAGNFMFNVVAHFDSLGKELWRKQLAQNIPLTNLLAEQNSDSFYAVFSENNLNTGKGLILMKANDSTVYWEKEFGFKGEVIDIQHLDKQNILLFANIFDENQKNKLVVLQINKQDKNKVEIIAESPAGMPFFGKKIFQIAENEILIAGFCAENNGEALSEKTIRLYYSQKRKTDNDYGIL